MVTLVLFGGSCIAWSNRLHLSDFIFFFTCQDAINFSIRGVLEAWQKNPIIISFLISKFEESVDSITPEIELSTLTTIFNYVLFYLIVWGDEKLIKQVAKVFRSKKIHYSFVT